MPEKRLAIVAAADEGYAMPLAVTLSSALRRLPEAVVPEVHVFDAGLRPGSAARLKRRSRVWHGRSELHLHGIGDSAFSMIETGRYPPSALLRLFIPDVLPDHHERALYLDCDIVVERDVSELWTLPLGDHPILAVEDVGYVACSAREKQIHALWEGNGIPMHMRYFNSGVLLMNVALWRRERLGDRVLDLLRNRPDAPFEYPDQDAMNIVLAGRWGELGAVWNTQILALPSLVREHLALDGAAAAEPRILHYTGSKPWGWTSHRLYFRNFLRAYAESGWDGPAVAAWRRATFVGRRVRSALTNRVRRGASRDRQSAAGPKS